MFIVIPALDGVVYKIDTEDQVLTALEAMKAAGVDRLPIWHGEPEDPDAYKDEKQFLSA